MPLRGPIVLMLNKTAFMWQAWKTTLALLIIKSVDPNRPAGPATWNSLHWPWSGRAVLAPTMATLILAPWEFWLSCKNCDRGGNTNLCLSQEGVCGAAGGRWVTRRLQGSDPLDLWPNSISPSTISLSLSDIISQAMRDSYPMPALGKKIATHTLPVLTLLPFARLCATIGGWLSRHNRALFTRIILRESKPVFLGELMLHWCLVAMGPGLRPRHKGMTFLFSCIVTYWVDTNYPAFSIYQFSHYLMGRGQTEPFHVGHLLKWL